MLGNQFLTSMFKFKTKMKEIKKGFFSPLTLQSMKDTYMNQKIEENTNEPKCI